MGSGLGGSSASLAGMDSSPDLAGGSSLFLFSLESSFFEVCSCKAHDLSHISSSFAGIIYIWLYKQKSR